MLENYVAVSYEKPSWGVDHIRRVDDIFRTFERYGHFSIFDSTMMGKMSGMEFILLFERTSDAQHCVADSKRLLDENNLIVEKARIPDNYMDLDEFEVDNGIDNPDLPSLMNLNDDCLLHLLKFLPEEYLLGYVSMRMRRLCKSKEKINHFNNFKNGMNIIFNHGPLFTHVSLIMDIKGYSIEFLKLIRVRCLNMKFLSVRAHDVTGGRHCEKEMQCLLEIMPSLKELVFDVNEPREDFPNIATRRDVDKYKRAITSILDALDGVNLKKLRMNSNLKRYTTLSFSEFNPTPWTSLTVLIFPRFQIDIGRVLGQLPSLRVLACVLVQSEEYPKIHELRDFYGFVPDNQREWKPALLSLSKVCPGLRNLRLRGLVGDYEDITLIFPELDGLYLEDCSVEYDGSTFETMKNADLKTFIFWHSTEELILTFSKLFSHFRKLEVLFWEKRIHGDIDDMLNNRPDNCYSLTVITEDQPTEEEKKTKYPKVRWARRVEDFFGPFCIFNVPAKK